MVAAIVSCIIKSLYYFAMCANNANLFHKRMLKRVINAPMRFFDLNPIGRLQLYCTISDHRLKARPLTTINLKQEESPIDSQKT